MREIFITGGTGYIGKRLIKALSKEGEFHIKALVRKQSAHKLPPGCEPVTGNALDAATYQHLIPAHCTFIHLVGVPHPSPRKKEAFREIDGVSIREAARAASQAHVQHFIYISVSQYPSQLMKDYQQVRAMGENLLKDARLPSTILRPWYVLGPGHWWPVLLLPLYGIAWLFPASRDRAREQGLVTIGQMINALLHAVHHTAQGSVIYTVPDIRHAGSPHHHVQPAGS